MCLVKWLAARQESIKPCMQYGFQPELPVFRRAKTLYLEQGIFGKRKSIVEPFRYLIPELAVAAQLQPEDMARAAAEGFTRVINNRPDAEEAGQPACASMRAAAEAAGLEYHDLPVVAGNLTDDNVAGFAQLAKDFDGPVLLFCRSGTRCTHLWALQQAWSGQRQIGQIVAAAAQAGYNIESLVPRMQTNPLA